MTTTTLSRPVYKRGDVVLVLFPIPICVPPNLVPHWLFKLIVNRAMNLGSDFL
jgi:hypothetical protein